jgi:calmodulin-binding transcription activator
LKKVLDVSFPSLWRSLFFFFFFPYLLFVISVIQNKYRSYCESKRFKQSLNSGCESTAVTSSKHNSCKNIEKTDTMTSTNNIASKDTNQNTSGLKRTYSQATQNQAARKIQQFMLTAKNK